MRVKIGAGALLFMFCAVPFASAADMPKSGKYSAHFGWVFKGDVQELGTDRSVALGMVDGVIFNNAGSGFLHKVRADCALMNDVDHGHANAHGTCVMTDPDGDKVFLEWKCAGTMPACPGDERFVGGTGKYKGISGNNKFQGNFIGNTGAGWSDWNGEYRIP
ncbi:MAG: hypothetical protein WAN65_09905 [Candidatus Sulfotelmatobacter sp.]